MYNTNFNTGENKQKFTYHVYKEFLLIIKTTNLLNYRNK